jgi:low temperature requirement protein LtrA
MATNVTPLSSSFMLTSMIGFLLSAFWIYEASKTWGITFMLFFGAMFVASVISMTYSPIDFDERRGRKK